MCGVESHAIKTERHMRIYHTFDELSCSLSPTISTPLRLLISQNM